MAQSEDRLMDLFSQVLIFLIFAGSVGYVVQPLLRRTVPPLPQEEDLEALKLKKRVIYRQIKELEMDFEVGNLNREDYVEARNRLKREVAEVIRQIKARTRSRQ
jgi:cell division protein FtsB